MDGGAIENLGGLPLALAGGLASKVNPMKL
jgi:hypothetical protein